MRLMFLMGRMETVTQLCTCDPGLFPEQLMGCAVAWAGMRAVFHMGWAVPELCSAWLGCLWLSGLVADVPL